VPATAFAVPTTLTLSKDVALAGEAVTASGQSDPDAFISVKILDSNQSIILYEVVKSDANGNYSLGFNVPANAEGILQVVAGPGANVAVKALLIGVPSTQVSLNLNKNCVSTGDTLIATGTADPGSWVCVKAVDGAGTIAFFDAVKAEASGNYSISLVIPDIEEGVLRVIAGYGDKTASQWLTIGQVTGSVTLTINSNSAAPGDSITASGTADPGSWVCIKAVNNAGEILFFDAVKANASGNYSMSFAVPENSAGELDIIAGYGINIASQKLSITASVDECFIATAAFGSKFEPSVTLLRTFRDQFLLTNAPGSVFVDFYYRHSPPIANYIAHNDTLKAATRVCLVPVIALAYMLLHPLAFCVTMGLILGTGVYRFRKRQVFSY